MGIAYGPHPHTTGTASDVRDAVLVVDPVDHRRLVAGPCRPVIEVLPLVAGDGLVRPGAAFVVNVRDFVRHSYCSSGKRAAKCG